VGGHGRQRATGHGTILPAFRRQGVGKEWYHGPLVRSAQADGGGSDVSLQDFVWSFSGKADISTLCEVRMSKMLLAKSLGS